MYQIKTHGKVFVTVYDINQAKKIAANLLDNPVVTDVQIIKL